jgi:hypothetical protein
MSRRSVTRLLAALVLATGSAGAAMAADYVLDDITIVSTGTTYSAKRVEVIGAQLSREEALKLLTADNATPPADRMARLDVAKIFIPELVSETKADGYLQRVVYSNLAITGVVHGLAAHVDAAGAGVESQNAMIASKGRIGAFRAEGVDFPAIAEITTQARAKADEPRRITTALFSMDGMEADFPDGAKIKVGGARGRNFGGRRLAAPMSSLVDLSPRSDAGFESPEAGRALAAMMSDLLASVEMGSFEFNDLAVTRPGDDKAEILDFSLKRVAAENVVDGRIGALAIEGLETRSATDPLRIGRIALAGLDIKSSLDAGVAGRLAVPHFDKLEIADVSGARDGGAFGLARLTIAARDWLKTAPSVLATRVEHAMASLAGAAAARAPMAAALGYDKLDISGAFDIKFDPAKGEIELDELSGEDKSVGATRLSALFNHASPALFGGDLERARAAAAALVFLRADLRMTEHGAPRRRSCSCVQTCG